MNALLAIPSERRDAAADVLLLAAEMVHHAQGFGWNSPIRLEFSGDLGGVGHRFACLAIWRACRLRAEDGLSDTLERALAEVFAAQLGRRLGLAETIWDPKGEEWEPRVFALLLLREMLLDMSPENQGEETSDTVSGN